MLIKIVYNSPAMPQGDYNFALNTAYECEKVKDKYVIKGANSKKEFALEFLKSIFKPCEGYSWDMLEEKKEIKENATKKVAKSIKK